MTTETNQDTNPKTGKSVHIIVNRRPLTVHAVEVTGATLLVLAGFDGTEWDLLEIQGEHDPTGGILILAAQELDLKDGEQFRVIPGNRTFGGRR